MSQFLNGLFKSHLFPPVDLHLVFPFLLLLSYGGAALNLELNGSLNLEHIPLLVSFRFLISKIGIRIVTL